MTDCRTVKSDVRRGEQEKWKSHLETCEDCRLFAAHHALFQDKTDDVKMPSAAGIEKLFQNVTAETGGRNFRTRLATMPGLYRWLISVCLVSLIVLSVVLFRARADLHVYPSSRFFTELFVMGGALSLFLWLAIRPLHKSPVVRWKVTGLMAVAAVMVAVPFILPEAHHAHPESLKGVGDDLWARALACFVWGSVIGAFLAVAGRFLLRGGKKSAVLNVPLLWAAGLLALLSLHLHCPIVHPLHIALGHSSIMVGVWCVLLVPRGVKQGHLAVK